MPSNINWHPDRFRRPFDAELRRRAELCGSIGVARARLLAGRPGTPQLRSLPGEPPRRQSGRLVESTNRIVIASAMAIYAVIYQAANHAVYLAKGTPKMAARPSLQPMLTGLRDVFRSILIRGG